MDKKRLEQILSEMSDMRVIVFGDYFLDNYLTLDRNLSETSLETGLEAYQVVETRKYPGVSGVVAANMRSLGVNVLALGLYGDDGNGYDLRKKLVENGVDIRGFIEIPGYATPTYHKPMLREADGQEHELNRMDVKPRLPLTPLLEDQLIYRMNCLLPEADGLLVVDQSKAENCGVISDRIRKEVGQQAAANAHKVFTADSRNYLGLFTSVILKANLSEAIRAAGLEMKPGESTAACAQRCGQTLFARTNRPVIITLGSEGIFLIEDINQAGMIIPAIPVKGPVDIVGAGDSVNASAGSALCAGATLEEACFLANLVASVVIQQIGVTGTASHQQVMDQYISYFEK
jgi:rfaE bifunctional protein kinase chain/domain